MVAGIWLAAFAVFIAGWVGLYMISHHFGFELQTTPQYGFASGIGPMYLAAIGYSSLVAGLWHSLNCHEPGCWRIGRHKVSGTPWCNVHHEAARGDTVESRLDRLITLLEQRGQPG